MGTKISLNRIICNIYCLLVSCVKQILNSYLPCLLGRTVLNNDSSCDFRCYRILWVELGSYPPTVTVWRQLLIGHILIQPTSMYQTSVKSKFCNSVPSIDERMISECLIRPTATTIILLDSYETLDQYIGLFLYSSPIQKEANVLV